MSLLSFKVTHDISGIISEHMFRHVVCNIHESLQTPRVGSRIWTSVETAVFNPVGIPIRDHIKDYAIKVTDELNEYD